MSFFRSFLSSVGLRSMLRSAAMERPYQLIHTRVSRPSRTPRSLLKDSATFDVRSSWTPHLYHIFLKGPVYHVVRRYSKTCSTCRRRHDTWDRRLLCCFDSGSFEVQYEP
ncbi:unnamed protein product [Haemonchus placei]|uniref:Secreted protein n=1 Tax=Haemonchus placei TaxID=6290 RepID=A0A0N4X1I1_HAEPC|nr:unnamed protein product [Haemonchus placei]